MIDLHDSHGRHIANFVSGQLHDVQGRNIGHYLENEGIFINMQGYYFYQIVDKRRLATIWDCCSVDSLETETPKEITNMFDSIGKLTSKIQFE